MKHFLLLIPLFALIAHPPAHAYLPGGCSWPFLKSMENMAPQPERQLPRQHEPKNSTTVTAKQPLPSNQAPIDVPHREIDEKQ